MTISASNRVDAYRFFAIAFGAAPGAEYYSQLVAAYDAGLTTKEVVNIFTTKSQFTSVYPTSLSNTEFASKIVDNVVGTSATAAAKTQAKKDVKDALDFGMSRGDIIFQLFQNLANKSSDDAQWGGTAKLMQNQVEVSKYVTESRPLNTTDLAMLQKVLKSVTATTDVSTLEAIKAVVNAAGVNVGSLTPLTANADTYTGTTGNDSVDGGLGNDTLQGGDGNDVIFGGAGNDSLLGERGRDYIEGGAGDDEIQLGSYIAIDAAIDDGINSAGTYYRYTLDAHFEVADGGEGADTIYGSYGRDLIYGGDGADTIYGDSGFPGLEASDKTTNDSSLLFNDTIDAGAGNDLVWGDAGDDVIRGQAGDDTLDGGAGNDFLDGGEGADNLFSYGGSDTLIGGAGDDTISIEGSSINATITVDAGVGNDFVYFYSEVPMSATLKGGEGADRFEITPSRDAQITVDLNESVQAKDEVYVTPNQGNDKPLNPVVVKGFALASDVLDLDVFDLYGSTARPESNGNVQSLLAGTLSRNYAQAVTNTSTPWTAPTGTGVDAAGKGFFVIKGAQAASADVATVAAFLDPYGNNATYAKAATHYFAVDVASRGMAIYRFTDDGSGANARIAANELTPVVLLTGVSTTQLDVNQVNFLLTQ